MDPEKTGKFISELRNKKNLTQNDLALKINVTNKAVSRWERGVGFPDISLLEPLSKELNVSILELLKGQHIKSNSPSEKEDINTLLQMLIKINKRDSFQKKIFTILIILMFLVVILVYCFNSRFYGFDNSYLFLISNRISLIPFNNLYSLFTTGEIVNFLKNIVVNILLAIPISILLVIFTKKKRKYIIAMTILNIIVEIFKLVLLIGIFDIDDILIRCISGTIIYYIYYKIFERK